MVQALLPFPHIDPVLLHIWGPLEIRWYALSYIAGLVLAICGLHFTAMAAVTLLPGAQRAAPDPGKDHRRGQARGEIRPRHGPTAGRRKKC